MIAVACHQRRLAVGHKRDMARSRLRISEIDLAGRGQRLVGDGENRHGAVIAVGNQRQSARRIDRKTGRGDARLDGRYHRRRLGLQIDDRDLVIGGGLLRIGGIDLDRAGHQREAFVPGNGDALRRADNAGGRFHLADDLGRLGTEVDNGDGVRGRVLDDDVLAVHVNHLVVVGRYRDLRGGNVREQGYGE